MVTPNKNNLPSNIKNSNHNATITNAPTSTNTAIMHYLHHNTTTYNITFPHANKDGPLMKAYRMLGSHGNPMLGACLSQQIFTGMFTTPGSACTLETQIHLFGEQLAPFLLLAIIKPDNEVIVPHGIK